MLRAITPEIADKLEIPPGKGVIVQDVKPGSFADDIGVARGDVILEVNKQPVSSEDQFNRIQIEPEERPRCGISGSPAGRGQPEPGPSSSREHYPNDECSSDLALDVETLEHPVLVLWIGNWLLDFWVQGLC